MQSTSAPVRIHGSVRHDESIDVEIPATAWQNQNDSAPCERDGQLTAWLTEYLKRCDCCPGENAEQDAVEIIGRARVELMSLETDRHEASDWSSCGGPSLRQLQRRCIAIAVANHVHQISLLNSVVSGTGSEIPFAREVSRKRDVVPEVCHRRMTRNETPPKLWFLRWIEECRRRSTVFYQLLLGPPAA